MPHILLIDDDYELTGLLKELLMLEGFTVSEANDGAIGLAIAQNAALQHNGNIKAEHSMLGGLKVTIIFPDTQK